MVEPEPSFPPGLEYTKVVIAETDVEAEVFVADLTEMRLVALDARAKDRSIARVDVLRAEQDALVVVNGTFFSPKAEPLGLLRQGSVEMSALREADWGVLEVDEAGRARLVHTRDYVPGPTVDFAVQCGPRVVIDGDVPRLKKQSALRTALCIRTEQEIALVVTRGPVLADVLGAWLAAPESPSGLGCRDALLLDGGPSTQLSARVGDFELDVPGGWGVPNGIGLVAR